MRKIATLELLSNRRLEMLKHVRDSEVDMGIWELYSSRAQNSFGRPLFVELNRWPDELTLNVVVRMVAGLTASWVTRVIFFSNYFLAQ
jgi:hypothetical protein